MVNSHGVRVSSPLFVSNFLFCLIFSSFDHFSARLGQRVVKPVSDGVPTATTADH